ncbi:multifunctional CCA addition/repair protein [Reinekea marinisedimentorum]|uniref:Multifunctional CCA protein n=1 Tax=Reinekea marinisedimentorum TaxID=230495 RepID=A0A4V2UIQ9_9GAMM|nr:multifunctional CCA addition/repair protein [Reinekea marinisedimentorum]TCS37150.1 tRNA nucleotidyltransferase (CCA-adding enzyme) [Reinekea marinisedimentorum]
METYLVGGAVRDELLGLEVKDRDWVVVGATPAQLLEQGYQQVGADFPVFLHPQTKEEYALARTERKSGVGYKGFEVNFDPSVTLEDDLLRRDLTINAIAQSKDGQLIDPYNGRRDLENRVLRHVSPAFREDPLRVLRIARFYARFAYLGFSVHEQTLSLMTEMTTSGELEHLVAERVWSEISRALTSQSPEEFFFCLKQTGALAVVFPELDRLFGKPQPMRWHPEVDTGIHVLMALKVARTMTSDPATLLAALCHDLGKGLTASEVLPSHKGHEGKGADLIPGIAKRMKWPVKAAQLTEDVARYHTHCHDIEKLKPATVLKLLKNINAFRQPERVEQFAMACEADYRGRSGFENNVYRQAALLKALAGTCADVSAEPFIAQGLKGKDIGEAMDKERLNRIRQLRER